MGSRYLFIVLYAFLEHHLSRGDYRRPGFDPRAGHGHAPVLHERAGRAGRRPPPAPPSSGRATSPSSSRTGTGGAGCRTASSRSPRRRSRPRRRSWWTTARPTGRSSCSARAPGVRVIEPGPQHRLRLRRQPRRGGRRERARGAREHRRRARARTGSSGWSRRSSPIPARRRWPARWWTSRDPTLLYDAGDVLRRDGACEQRGRFERDDGRFDAARRGVRRLRRGRALQARRGTWTPAASTSASSPTSRTWTSRCACGSPAGAAATSPSWPATPARARSVRLSNPLHFWVERNTLLLLAKAFPLRWLPWVAYRQLGWAWHAQRQRRLGAHLRGARGGAAAACPRCCASAVPLRDARACRWSEVVPARPIRGTRGGRPPLASRRGGLRCCAPVRELLGPLRRRRAAAARLRRGARRRARAGLPPEGPLADRADRGRAARGAAARAPARAARLAARRAARAALRLGAHGLRGAPAGPRPAARTCSWRGACAPRSRSAGAARRRAAANRLPAQRPAPRRRPSAGSCAAVAARFDRVWRCRGPWPTIWTPPARWATRLRVCHPGVDLERFSALPRA